MVKSKIVTVRDTGTRMEFLISKFEEKDKEKLSKTGWGLSPTLTLIVRLESSVEASMSHFVCPEFDIPERGNLGVNHTTVELAKYVRSHNIEEMPDTIDLIDFKRKRS